MSIFDQEDVIIGIIFGAAIVFIVAVYAQHKTNKLIKQCEASLPRTQQCVLIAVPETPETAKRQE
jgi:CDP-diglyceride synthetase